LERRWNERLASMRMLEDQLAQITAQPVGFVGAEDRERLLTLGADLTLAWNSPSVSIETRRRSFVCWRRGRSRRARSKVSVWRV
jgi:hypothetical protein